MRLLIGTSNLENGVRGKTCLFTLTFRLRMTGLAHLEKSYKREVISMTIFGFNSCHSPSYLGVPISYLLVLLQAKSSSVPFLVIHTNNV